MGGLVITHDSSTRLVGEAPPKRLRDEIAELQSGNDLMNRLMTARFPDVVAITDSSGRPTGVCWVVVPEPESALSYHRVDLNHADRLFAIARFWDRPEVQPILNFLGIVKEIVDAWNRAVPYEGHA
jgi:hypothetical protein